MIKASPQKIIAGTDWWFLDELKRELKYENKRTGRFLMPTTQTRRGFLTTVSMAHEAGFLPAARALAA